jgi:hypothetical protein
VPDFSVAMRQAVMRVHLTRAGPEHAEGAGASGGAPPDHDRVAQQRACRCFEEGCGDQLFVGGLGPGFVFEFVDRCHPQVTLLHEQAAGDRPVLDLALVGMDDVGLARGEKSHVGGFGAEDGEGVGCEGRCDDDFEEDVFVGEAFGGRGVEGRG